jgi:membrane fusion protein, multidrug efflux system
MNTRNEMNSREQTSGIKMKSRKGYIAVTSVAVFVGAAAFIMMTSRNTQADAAGIQMPATAVEVTPVAVADVAETVSGVGSVEAMRDVRVASETAGRVLRVFVDVGAVVKEGQPLLQVDAELKEAAADQARAQVLAAKTNLEKSKKDYERTQKLFASGDVADVELEGYRLGYQSAEAQYKGAVAALRVAERQVSDSRIKAPVAGVVATRPAEVGEMVTPGMEIANIVDISSLKVKLSIAEEDIMKLRVGQPAVLRIDPRPGEHYVGKVYTVGAKSETPNGHTYPVEVVMQNKSRNPLKVGMFARVEIQAGLARNALAIAKESLVEDGANPTVFVAKDGIARLRRVNLGLRGQDLIEVVNGLAKGELVISFGQKALKDGAPVQYK